MKNLLLVTKYPLLFLFVLFLSACSDDKTDMPQLDLTRILFNGGDEDYARNLKKILPLRRGEYIDVFFELRGNGADLASFVVKSDSENVNATISFYPENEVADDFLPTDDMIRYKDGVRNTNATVTLKVRSAKKEDVRVSFYLNSKAPDSEGAVFYLDLETATEPRETNDE